MPVITTTIPNDKIVNNKRLDIRKQIASDKVKNHLIEEKIP